MSGLLPLGHPGLPRDGDGAIVVPQVIATAGDHATRRYLEFFAATIRNPYTREARLRAVRRFFAWCQARGVRSLRQIELLVVAAYIEELSRSSPAPTTKQHLAAIRMLLDWLTTGGVLPFNPAASVREPAHRVNRGRTPVLTAEQARQLMDSLPLTKPDGRPDLAGLRDWALVGVMAYSFARVSATVAMRVEDYFAEGKRWWFAEAVRSGSSPRDVIDILVVLLCHVRPRGLALTTGIR